MPELRLDPRNQCLADGSSVEEEEAARSTPSPPPPAAAFGGGEGPAGPENAGSDALVRRFDSGAAASRGGDDRELPPCIAEEIKAVVSCGVALATSETPAFYFAALNCIASVITVDQCLRAHSDD